VAKSLKREVSVRFLEVFDQLVENEEVESMKEFCRRMDYLPQSMTQLRIGKRDVNIELVVKLFQEFRGNPIYVLLGYDKKILEENEVPAFPKNLVSLDSNAGEAKLIKRLEDLVDSKIEIIALLKKEVERLTIELGIKGK
jgi:hypothetical protein